MHVCRRCLVLYPVALVTGIAISIGSWWPDDLNPWVLWLFPLPGRDRVRARQPGPDRVLAACARCGCRRRAPSRPGSATRCTSQNTFDAAGLDRRRRVHRGLRGRRVVGRPPRSGTAEPRDQTRGVLAPRSGSGASCPAATSAITDGELLVLIACNILTTVGLTGDIARHLQNPRTSRATSSRAGTSCSTAASPRWRSGSASGRSAAARRS